jgi:hypothetical protein
MLTLPSMVERQLDPRTAAGSPHQWQQEHFLDRQLTALYAIINIEDKAFGRSISFNMKDGTTQIDESTVG